MRRVLTSDMADEPMVPLDALDFLLRVQAADAPAEPVQAEAPPVPDDAWTLERLLTEQPPERFHLWYPAGDVADLDRSSFMCQRCHAKPPALTPVILRHEQLPDGIAAGRWYARELEDGTWQVRLRKSRGNSPQLQISTVEYEALLPIAIIQPPD